MALPSSVAEDPQSSEPAAPTFDFPLGWLLDRAAPPIAYRSYVDVAGLAIAEGNDLASLTLSSPTALALAATQTPDGVWNDRMLTIPSGIVAAVNDPSTHAVDLGSEQNLAVAQAVASQSIAGVGTIPATRRLLEYGWDRESLSLPQARRILFRLLAEDDDPNYLFELRDEVTSDETALRARNILREASAAALAQAGYEGDPRLRGAARRILERIDAFLDSELAEKPWVRIGNRHVLAAEASPPSIHSLTMLAYMPIFRSEHYPTMERLFTYLTQPKPTQEAVLKAAKTAEDRGWKLSEEKATWYLDQLKANKMKVLPPSPQLKSGLEKIGETLTADWIKRAGANGQAVIDAYKKM